MRITPEIVRRVARLASLALAPDEVARMQRDLDAVLGYVEQLGELDTTDVAPTAHVLELATPLREDRVAGVLPVEEAVRNAPQHDESSMVVPKVVE